MELTVPETLLIRRTGTIVTAALHRAERQNAIDGTMLRELHALLDDAETDSECDAIVIEGSSGVFCAGMDLEEIASAPDAGEFMRLLRRISLIPRIVVANVDGSAIGGGVGLAAACDLVVATPRSEFSLPEALWGMLPCCVLPYLIRRTGFQQAYRMALTTAKVSAAEALTCRLADEVGDDLQETTRRLLLRPLRVAHDTIGDLKRFARTMWIVDEECEHHAVEEIVRLAGQDRVRETVASFLKHRHPAGGRDV